MENNVIVSKNRRDFWIGFIVGIIVMTVIFLTDTYVETNFGNPWLLYAVPLAYFVLSSFGRHSSMTINKLILPSKHFNYGAIIGLIVISLVDSLTNITCCDTFLID